MQVTVIGKVMEVEMDVNIAKNGGGTYKGTRIIYKDQDGSLKEQNMHSNALKFNPAMKQILSELTTGDQFTMIKEKEGEFWNVKSISKGVVQATVSEKTGTASAGTGNSSPKSTYQTAEERAQTQVYIVRQSSITAALTWFNLANLKGDTPPDISDVLAVARQFEAHVFGNDFDDGSIENLKSDIL